MSTDTIPVEIADPINSRILEVAEDNLKGFQEDPLGEIARQTDLDVATVIERIRAMLEAGVIRRVRQTMLATSLAKGALVAWEVDQENLDSAFNYLFEKDPFSGHVVTRTTDTVTAGSSYKLWTTLKVPQGYSLNKHCEYLAPIIGAKHFRTMSAKKLFALGVGHMRRKKLEPGERAPELAEPTDTTLVELNALEWRVMTSLKREFEPAELVPDIWAARAKEAGVSKEEFLTVARCLDKKKVVGRFSTFLEHVKRLQTGERVTKFNALFHWAVPVGREIDAGREVGRHYCMTHAYWREGGPEFKNVNVMGVIHGTEKEKVLAHKAAIDKHLEEEGFSVSYTNVFWGGRSEIKPSEISPIEYVKYLESEGIDPESMKE
ncbi:MAG: DNA-binding Lrp family transcriptional regulator [Limisphaerales bacterium]|jgi:DNA-binding Lrp family transcriptional regulator